MPAPEDIDTKFPVLVNVLSRYHGLLQFELEPFVQQSVRPNSALTIPHWVQVELELKKVLTLVPTAAQHQFVCS